MKTLTFRGAFYGLTALALSLTACQKEDITPLEEPTTTYSTTETQSGCYEEFTLYAGQHIEAGSITVSNDNSTIYVTYQTTGGWVLDDLHLYVGDLSGLPTNGGGNPQIGQFPYAVSDLNGTSYTFEIPVDPNFECYVIAAHAAVYLEQNGQIVQSETAWGDGNPSAGNSWATYGDYCLLDCCEYEVETYEYFAGQNISIGNLEVTNDDVNLYVTYSFTGDWYMGQTHLYVGDAAGLPTNPNNIPVPGQFPYSTAHDPAVQSYTYTIPLAGLSDCYVIAAHAEAMQIENGVITQTETGWSFGTEFPNSPRWGWYSEYCTQVCQ